MKTFRLAFVVVAAIGSAMSIAHAMPGTLPAQLNAAADSLSLVEKTQFFIGSQEYCWYDDGWHGPGWYWCGYALRQGFGWGGSSGWHNWDRHHPPRLHGPGSSHNPRPAPKPIITRHPSHPAAPKPITRHPSHPAGYNPNEPPAGSHGGGHPTDPNPRPR
jgi:hypothetical protein